MKIFTAFSMPEVYQAGNGRWHRLRNHRPEPSTGGHGGDGFVRLGRRAVRVPQQLTRATLSGSSFQQCKPIPAVLSGGSGTRLWPLSRAAHPKQFHAPFGGESLFQRTCRRIGTETFAAPIILGAEAHRFLMAEQARQVGCDAREIVLAPAPRGTGPAALIASLLAAREREDALVLLVPSDHLIGDDAAFEKAVLRGCAAARSGAIVTFGVTPESPHTGYGYIEAAPGEGDLLTVRRFVEKPPRAVAENFLESGRHYWNSGVFLFAAATMIDAFERFCPEMVSPCARALEKARRDLDFLRLEEAAFAACETISVDHAIMEKAENLVCAPLPTTWSDLGAWPAVARHLPADERGNVQHGEALFVDSRNCLAYSANGAGVAMMGVEDVAAVVTDDAVLVMAADMAENVRALVGRWREKGRADLVDDHPRVHRPWGWYQRLARGERFQVKMLMVKPGGALSLQRHRRRSEHWVVVSGRVRALVDGQIHELTHDQSVYVPLGIRHRLENPHAEPALLIEVQCGDYLGEDDIIRYQDPEP
jgi:mannose-1-phosphate guanylyltransferase/mannose-6-phosphate isomerase